MKAIVVVNEQHTLFPQQVEILDGRFTSWEVWPIPKEGYSKEQLQKLRLSLEQEMDHSRAIVFASPVPVLVKWCSYYAGARDNEGAGGDYEVFVFHNPEVKLFKLV